MANLGQNLVEQQYELENVPMQRLVQMAQQPDGLFPQYLVLTELERRNRYKQAYDAEKASMVGDTTVAQDLVNESVGAPPAGINTLGPSSSLSNQVNPAGGITQAGPQMMASGGAVRRYKKGGGTLSDDEINYIASTALGVLEGPKDYFPNKYPEKHSLVFGQGDDDINWLDNIGDVNQLEALYRSFSEKDLQREDLNKINQRLFDLEEQADVPFDRQMYDLGRNIFDFDTNQAYLDNYYSQYYPLAEDKEGLASLLSKRSEATESDEEFWKREDILNAYRGEENLASYRKYRDEEYPILEEALRKKMNEKDLEFFNEGATGEVVRIESMIPNLIDRTDASGTAIDYIRSIYPDKGDRQIEEIWSNLSEERKTEINNMLEKDFHLHGGPLINPSTGRPDWWNTDAEPFKEGGLTSLDTSIPKPTREQIAKAREMYPDADYETILDIAAGIDTMDITTNENRYKTGGIARFNQGGGFNSEYLFNNFNTVRAIPPQIVSEGDNAVLDYYNTGLEALKNQRLQKEKEILERVGGDASKLTFRDSRALEFIDREIEKTQYNVDRMNRRINKKAERVPFETEEGQTIVSDFVGTDDKVVEEVQPNEDTQTEIDELENAPDMLASEVERYAGILGLPSAEERKRNKTTSLLLGLGSAISQATQPGDIAKGFPGIQKMLVAEDRQAAKDKMGILNLMANQQKLGTLSKKDKLTLLQGQVETLQKQLEQPISEKEREVILKKIADLNLLIDASLGTSNIGVQTYQEYKENRKGT